MATVTELVKTGLFINTAQAVASGTFEEAIATTGNVSFYPAASATPASNGQLVFELTADTTLTIKVKGSDGTVRSAAITLAP